jgi:hypothetical protein
MPNYADMDDDTAAEEMDEETEEEDSADGGPASMNPFAVLREDE